jgi:hypothetical protein
VWCCYDYLGKIKGYDVEKGLPKFLCGAKIVNYDGRLCVVWEGTGECEGGRHNVVQRCVEKH